MGRPKGRHWCGLHGVFGGVVAAPVDRRRRAVGKAASRHGCRQISIPGKALVMKRIDLGAKRQESGPEPAARCRPSFTTYRLCRARFWGNRRRHGLRRSHCVPYARDPGGQGRPRRRPAGRLGTASRAGSACRRHVPIFDALPAEPRRLTPSVTSRRARFLRGTLAPTKRGVAAHFG